MNIRSPSVRRPNSFYDVFSVVAAAVIIMGIVLAVRYGTGMREALVVFMVVVFGWAVWAMERILADSGSRAGQRRLRP
ncbi:hypothetical protein [Natrinema marinum]|uniref:hypothetical protein n=1 Tax=Natrinema marinum TaxID=2961598 RepID=UPI0020C90EB1|nr:hypothetical protein [Natrinema marinum]